MATERALLVTTQLDERFSHGQVMWPLEDEAAELKQLAVSSKIQVVGEFKTRRHRPVAGTFLGSGKLSEIAQAVEELQPQVVIFNRELSPAQQRNIEDVLRIKTIDRTQLILDIFAQRAKSSEGKVQVELAQLRYLLPRLVGKGIVLSRLGGGIGTRGPGEQKLEVDRRRIRSRITRLGLELERLGLRREAIRQRRKETEVPVVALVGYTNAGKTTLLNRLTGATSVVTNQLFTTLDPLARRMRLVSGEWVVLTDTVGFLHQLPHHLIEAFKATLEEARDAIILLNIVDASHPLSMEHAKAVEEVLAVLHLEDKPVITVLNKCDRVDKNGPAISSGEAFRPTRAHVDALRLMYEPAVCVSAKTGEELERLRRIIAEQLSLLLVESTQLIIPIERRDLLALVYRSGQVLRRAEKDGAIHLTVRLPSKLGRQLSSYIVS